MSTMQMLNKVVPADLASVCRGRHEQSKVRRNFIVAAHEMVTSTKTFEFDSLGPRYTP